MDSKLNKKCIISCENTSCRWSSTAVSLLGLQPVFARRHCIISVAMKADAIFGASCIDVDSAPIYFKFNLYCACNVVK